MFNENLLQLAQQLVDNCNNGKEREGLDTLYHAEAVSAEAATMPGQSSNEVKGIEAIKGKHDWWDNANEIHSSSAKGPYLHGDNKFSVIFDMDVTNKENNERTQMQEVALYTVDNGKIIREEFFYGAG